MTAAESFKRDRGLMRAEAPPSLFRARAPRLLDRGDFELDRKLDLKPRRAKIRCPHCQWQPGRRASWTCSPAGAPEYFKGGCGTSWNTFDTKGICPGCQHRWRNTQCLSCGRWARHEDWYERGEGSPGKGAGG